MGKHICIVCGGRRPNVSEGIRSMASARTVVVGWVHTSCKRKTRAAGEH